MSQNNSLFTDSISAESLKVLFNTLVFSSKKHSTQKRKDPQETPYINHPIGVANYLILSGINDLATLQAALLHDTIEDTSTTHEELVKEFGKEVADIVQEVSDDGKIPKATRKLLQIQNASKLSLKAKNVRLADKLYNLTDMTQHTPVNWSKERVQEYLLWGKAVVENCLGVNEYLESKLNDLFTTGKFLYQGNYYKCIE